MTRQKMVYLAAEPEPLEIDISRSALVIVDMQNAFVSEGGMFDLRKFDISPNRQIIAPIQTLLREARNCGVAVIHVTHVLSKDLREVGPDSSFWYKSVRMFRENGAWAEKFIIRGTWGSEVVPELKPREGDLVIEKPRFSAFFGTDFDLLLKTKNIKNLLFTGCATNICVEASIRDAANLGYFPILISDATANNGPPITQESTIFNVKLCFGWVTRVGDVMEAVGKAVH